MTELEKKVCDLKREVRKLVKSFEEESGLYVKQISVDRENPTKTDEIDSITLALEA